MSGLGSAVFAVGHSGEPGLLREDFLLVYIAIALSVLICTSLKLLFSSIIILK